MSTERCDNATRNQRRHVPIQFHTVREALLKNCPKDAFTKGYQYLGGGTPSPLGGRPPGPYPGGGPPGLPGPIPCIPGPPGGILKPARLGGPFEFILGGNGLGAGPGGGTGPEGPVGGLEICGGVNPGGADVGGWKFPDTGGCRCPDGGWKGPGDCIGRGIPGTGIPGIGITVKRKMDCDI